jgi:hypothetical protein
MLQQIDIPPLAGPATTSVLPNSSRLGLLVRQFHRAVEHQRARDAELVAGLERVARDERVRRVIRQICQESEL